MIERWDTNGHLTYSNIMIIFTANSSEFHVLGCADWRHCKLPTKNQVPGGWLSLIQVRAGSFLRQFTKFTTRNFQRPTKIKNFRSPKASTWAISNKTPDLDWKYGICIFPDPPKKVLEISAGYEDVPPPRQRGERIQAGMRSKLMEEAERADCRDTDPEPFLGFEKHTKIRWFNQQTGDLSRNQWWCARYEDIMAVPTHSCGFASDLTGFEAGLPMKHRRNHYIAW